MTARAPDQRTIVVGSQSAEAMRAEWLSFRVKTSAPVEVVPPEWISPTAYGELRGISTQAAGAQLRNGYTAGQLERRSFRVETGQGVRAVFHYRHKRPPA